jgi:TRAP-type C4-dicarboxylate transport system permease small subunit
MELLDRIDAAIYRGEQLLVAAMLALMGLVVFLDVVHRVSADSDSLLASPLVVGGSCAVISMLALRTRSSPRWLPHGLGAGLGLALAQQLFVRLLPNGLVWSQTLALGFTLWLGLVGASLAARERRHLAIDIGSKLWPAAWAGKIAAVGHLLTAGFCLGMVWLGWRSLSAHYGTWAESDGAAGIFPVKVDLFGLELPIIKWLVFASVPYGMGVLAFRFLLDAARAWTNTMPVIADETLHQLGISAEGEAKP